MTISRRSILRAARLGARAARLGLTPPPTVRAAALAGASRRALAYSMGYHHGLAGGAS